MATDDKMADELRLTIEAGLFVFNLCWLWGHDVASRDDWCGFPGHRWREGV